MARVYDAEDTTEYAHDTDFEQFGNAHLFGVLSGCAVTYDAADLTVDIAAGQILNNGSVVDVSAQTNAVTLVADGTNPRWSTISLNASGVAVLTSGTAAAVPSKPETPATSVELAMVKVTAGATVANNIATKLDKRIWTHSSTRADKYASATQTVSASTTYVDAIAAGTPATFTFSMLANEVWTCEYVLRFVYTGTGGLKLQITGPAAPTAVRINGTSNLYDPSTLGSAFPYIGFFTAATAFSSTIANANAAAATAATYTTTDNGGYVLIKLFVQNGSNAGNVTLQFAQNSANGTTVLQIGSFMEARRIA